MLKEVLIEATHAGAAELVRFFNQDFEISFKEGKNNLVTAADHASEKAIINVIQKYFPEHYILTEESGDLPSLSNYKWVIDPIDGTINFAHGIPLNCVSIGIEKDGILVMGVVYNPHMNEFYFAEKGKGAFLNDKKISVSKEPNLMQSCLVTGFPYTYINDVNGPLEVFAKLIKEGVPVRRLGSAAIDLCWTAAGRIDGFYEHKLEPWDSAAGVLILEEAGGMVTNLKGTKFSIYHHGIIATNGRIHAQLVDLINE